MKKYRKFFVVIILCLCFFVSSKFSNIFASSSNDFNKDFYEFYKSLPKTNLEEYKICENLTNSSSNKTKGTIFQTLDLENGFSVDSLYNFITSYCSSDNTYDSSFKNINLPSLDVFKENYNNIYISLYPLTDGDGKIREISLELYFYDSNATFTNTTHGGDSSFDLPSGSNYTITAPYYHYYFRFSYYLINSGLGVSKPYLGLTVSDYTTDSSLQASAYYRRFYFNPEYVYKCNFDISTTDGLINFEADDFTVDTLGKKDAEIGDTSSRLKLSYEYNEEYTECKINATLEGGQFTDRIFYSNYMPSIARTRSIVKKSISTRTV